MKTLVIALSSVIMVACGGGGGGGTTLPLATPSAALNSANQTIAAQDTASTGYLPLMGAQTLTGAQTFDESVLFSIARDQLNKLPSYLADAKTHSTLTGAVQSQTYPCTNGGTVTASVSDADNNGVVSAGDSVTITGNNCVEQEGTLTGSIAFGINNVTGTFGSTSYSASITMTFNGFNVSSSQFSANANGSLSLSASESGVNNISTSVFTSSLSVTGAYAGVTRSRTLTNYTATSARTPNSTFGLVTSYTINGTLTSSALSSQSISFATTTPFVSLSSDYYPSSGVMVISGAANSKVKVSAQSNSQVKLELDANGDDAYEGSTMLDWNTLM
jgi:hypothetical protein